MPFTNNRRVSFTDAAPVASACALPPTSQALLHASCGALGTRIRSCVFECRHLRDAPNGLAGDPDDAPDNLSPGDAYRFAAAMALCLPHVQYLRLDVAGNEMSLFEDIQQRGSHVLSPLVPLAALTNLRTLNVCLPHVSTAALQADVNAAAALRGLEFLKFDMTCLVAPAVDAAAGRAGPSDVDLTPLSALVRLKALEIVAHASRPGEDGGVTFVALPPLLV